MAKYVVEFSPPEKKKSEPDDETDYVVNYHLILAPFQKQTQVEFNNIKLKETAVRFLTFVNPLEKPGQFILPPSSDGVFFNVYEFTLAPNSQCDISITWKPVEYGNMRKLIKIKQVDSNRKYDFVILGNCNGPPHKKFKGATYPKSKNSNLIKNTQNGNQKKMLNKPQCVNYETEKLHSVENPTQTHEPTCPRTPPQSLSRRQTFLVKEKENLPISKNNILGRETILTSPEHSLKRPDQKRQDHVFNSHFNFHNLNKSSSPMSDDSLDKPLKKMINDNFPFNDLCLTPLKSTENILSTLIIKKEFNDFDDNLSFDVIDGPLASTSSEPFRPRNTSTVARTHTPVDRKPTKVSTNLCNKFKKPADDNLNKYSVIFEKNKANSESCISPLEPESCSDTQKNCKWTPKNLINQPTMITWSGTRPKRQSFTIKNSPYYKCNSKSSMTSSKKYLKHCNTSPRSSSSRSALKLDEYDQFIRGLTNPELVYHNNTNDPFLKMSQYYETEWLNRQESDMIRWLNALLTPTDKLVGEEQSSDLEKAAIAWVEASKMNHKNKPMQFATEKDLFAAQIYRQSPQQWSALRKATKNLITSSSVSSVLSKLTISIEKDLITLRDDRQIHLDLSLKRKITDLLKCYNPLWFQIGLEAIYGQIVLVKPGSNDLDGLGWFIRKNLFINDFVKQKYTKTTVLQVNLPSYNIAMKKFILRKILMLIFFLDRAKEHQLIRHNPCLFKANSPFKSSYDLLMGFCEDMVTAHGDILRRMRNIGYTLTHKQTHLDEVNYAVKSLNDLRDGTRMTKVVEILFKGNALSQKLRLPAISKLQKIHNVNLALTRVSEHITIEGNINARDVVNGHREKILSLFWQIIYKYLTPRYNDAATRIQNWWRNRSLKLVVLKRIRAKQIAKRHAAASLIQSRVRGHLARKRWPTVRAELIENRQRLHAASTMIKRYLKDKLKLLTEDRKRFVILRRTVVVVQRKYRAKLALKAERCAYLRTKSAAVLIQKTYRGHALRKRWPQISDQLVVEKRKRTEAADTIKRAFRRNFQATQDRLRFLELKRSVAIVQTRYKANRLMKARRDEFVALKNAVLLVQRKFRANLAAKRQRDWYTRIRRSVLIVQKTFRGYSVRKNWPETRDRLVLEKRRRTDAINTVKRALRRALPPSRDRAYFLRLRGAALLMQRVRRANLIMAAQRDAYKALKSVAVFLQRKFRAQMAMEKERRNYLLAKRSAVLIQKTFRGHAVRRRWPTTKERLIREAGLRVDAANTIKRALKRNLPTTSDRLLYVELRRSVVIVQQKLRARNAGRAQRLVFVTLKTAAIVVQRRFRAKQAMEKERRNFLLAKQSAVLIQKTFRGHAIRRRWPTIKERLIREAGLRVEAANTIKRALRRNLPTTSDRLLYVELRRSVVIVQQKLRARNAGRAQRLEFVALKTVAIAIQRKFRAKRALESQWKRYVELTECAVMIQSAARGYLARRRWPELKRELETRRQILIQCSNTVKRALRRNLPITEERVRFLALLRVAVVVQSRWRGKVRAREYRRLRNAIVVVQRRFRANLAARRQRNGYVRAKAGVIRLQALIRGRWVRRRWPVLKRELQNDQRQRAEAADVIKRFLRRLLPPGPDRTAYLQLRRAAVVVQARYRATVAARTARVQYLALRECVVTVQRRFRARRAAKAQRMLYDRLRRSVVALQARVRGYLARSRWPRLKQQLDEDRLQFNNAATKIQSAFRGFLARKKLPEVKCQSQFRKLDRAATSIQALWKGYCTRKKFQCRRETIRIPQKEALTLAKRYNNILDVLGKQKKNEYFYKELATIFWNLDTCTALSRELCVKTAGDLIVDYIFRFLQYSNQSQPSVDAREPAIRVLINLLRYHQTSWHIWMRTVEADKVKELIKIMKTSCGKIGANKLYCSIATWLWIALQDPEKKLYIKNIPTAIIDLRFMLATLNKKYKLKKPDKKTMVLPSVQPTWSIGSKCQKCFDSDLYATAQLCKMLN